MTDAIALPAPGWSVDVGRVVSHVVPVAVVLIAVIALALFASVADARIPRSQAAKNAFVKRNACPATGLHKLPCAGHVIDHRVFLECSLGHVFVLAGRVRVER